MWYMPIRTSHELCMNLESHTTSTNVSNRRALARVVPTYVVRVDTHECQTMYESRISHDEYQRFNRHVFALVVPVHMIRVRHELHMIHQLHRSHELHMRQKLHMIRMCHKLRIISMRHELRTIHKRHMSHKLHMICVCHEVHMMCMRHELRMIHQLYVRHEHVSHTRAHTDDVAKY